MTTETTPAHTPTTMTCDSGYEFSVYFATDYDALAATTAKLRELLERYMFAYPAFSMRPVGAPGSQAREEQTRLMALEAAAQAALSSTTP